MKRLFWLGLSLLPVNFAQAQIPACLFENVVAFGASVTQATPAVIPGYKAIVAGVETYGYYIGDTSGLPRISSPLNNYKSHPYGWSPVRYFVESHAGRAQSKRITYTGSYVTQKFEDLGSSQIWQLIAGSNRALFDKASLLVGIDAFYWDAVWDTCSVNAPTQAIRDFTQEVKRAGKIAVLGTVPIENSQNVRIDSERIGVPGLWYAPKASCARTINKALNEYCRTEDGCYIVDLKSVADDLNCGGTVPLEQDGQSYSLYELRPDGVHMSDKGARYLAQRITQALAQRPPACR